MFSFAGSGATTIHAGSSYWRSDGSSSITRISVSTLGEVLILITFFFCFIEYKRRLFNELVSFDERLGEIIHSTVLKARAMPMYRCFRSMAKQHV